jgi:hypothetical protein
MFGKCIEFAGSSLPVSALVLLSQLASRGRLAMFLLVSVILTRGASYLLWEQERYCPNPKPSLLINKMYSATENNCYTWFLYLGSDD